jgi:excisionase family DNA binding protein
LQLLFLERNLIETNEPAYITTSEAAARLGVNIRTIQRWCRSGQLDARKPGRDWLISREAVEAMTGQREEWEDGTR